MARYFRRVDRDQVFLLPPDVREWLPAGHLAWFVIEVVESLELSGFAVRVTPRGSAAGRAAFDPRVLLGLLVYGYARGVRSSRKIERACTEDVAFRVICAQDGPDHATIARFRRQHFADPGVMGDLFGQVLVLAARAGLGNLGLIAVDGTKIAASASKGASRGEARLRELAREIVAEAEAVDAAEDELLGDARGDELPPDLADPVTRRDRIRAALADLESERKAARDQEKAARDSQDALAAEYLDAADRGMPRRGNQPGSAAAELARRGVERERAAQQARVEDWQARNAASLAQAGRPLPGGRPVPAGEYCRVRQARARLAAAQQRADDAARAAAEKDSSRRRPGPVRNITDPDSRLMPVRGGGFIQGYNAQAAHSSDGLCLAAAVTRDTTDYASYQPMVTRAQAAAGLLRAHARGPLHRRKARIGTVLADAGYCSEDNLAAPGPDRLIATGTRRDLEKTARHGPAAAQPARRPHAAAMAARLARPPDLAAYRRRGTITETPFGNAKHNRGFRSFSLRGLPRVTGEWTFENTIANLLKIRQATTPATA
jgi:transposase